jgi:hypothetical protein
VPRGPPVSGPASAARTLQNQTQVRPVRLYGELRIRSMPSSSCARIAARLHMPLSVGAWLA